MQAQIRALEKPEVAAAIAEIDAGKMTAYAAAKAHGVDRTTVARVLRERKLIEQQEPIIRKLYPTTNTEELAEFLDLKVKTLQKRASVYGIKKCKSFVSDNRSERMKNSLHGFKSGPDPRRHPPKQASVGLRMNLERNAEKLIASGHIWLANLTMAIVERIKARDVDLDFLKIHDDM